MLQKELTESEKKRGRKKEGKRKEMIKGDGQEGKTERKMSQAIKRQSLDILLRSQYFRDLLGISSGRVSKGERNP